MLEILAVEDGLLVTADDVSRLITRTELRNIWVDEIKGGPIGLPPAELELQIRAMAPSFALAVEDRLLLVRFEHVVSSVTAPEAEAENDQSDPDPEVLRLAHVAQFDIQGDEPIRHDVVSAWIDTNVYFMVYPYVREAIHSLTRLLGLPPLVLGYLKRQI